MPSLESLSPSDSVHGGRHRESARLFWLLNIHNLWSRFWGACQPSFRRKVTPVPDGLGGRRT